MGRDACHRRSDVIEPGAITLTCTNRAANALNETRLAALRDLRRTFFWSTRGRVGVREQHPPSPVGRPAEGGRQRVDFAGHYVTYRNVIMLKSAPTTVPAPTTSTGRPRD